MVLERAMGCALVAFIVLFAFSRCVDAVLRQDLIGRRKKILLPYFFAIIKVPSRQKPKLLVRFTSRKLAYTKLQLVKTAKLPLDAFQLDHWPKHLAFQTSFTQKLQFIWLTRVAYASWLAQARLNDRTPTSLKLTILTLTKLDQNQFDLAIFKLAKTVYLGQTGLVYSALPRTINSINRT